VNLRVIFCGFTVCTLLAAPAYAEWQVSADVRAGAIKADDLENTHAVQPWGVDTVTGATQKSEARILAVEANVTAAYIEAEAARLIGLHYVRVSGREAPYAQLRLSNLILAWRGADGSLEAGYVLTPSSWGYGLLVDRMRFSGGRARIEWGAPGRTEGFWTDTLEDSTRFRYQALNLIGVQHTTSFSGGEAGLSYLDASRDEIDVFPKRNCSRGSFAGVHAAYHVWHNLQLFSELAYGWLSSDGGRTQALLGGGRWSLGPSIHLNASAWHLGEGFNPATGFYNRRGQAETALRLTLPWVLSGTGVQLRPGVGWKGQYDEDFWVPSLELLWEWPAAGLSLKLYEYGEQPFGRWGAEDHWEYTSATLDWQVWTPLFFTARWEKIYDGFTHFKSQQLSGEVGLKY